jgi:hypothetical protein
LVEKLEKECKNIYVSKSLETVEEQRTDIYRHMLLTFSSYSSFSNSEGKFILAQKHDSPMHGSKWNYMQPATGSEPVVRVCEFNATF